MTPTEAALGVMDAHVKALNAQDQAALARTLHFPHFRLRGSDLKTWDSPDSYFKDFQARAGADWVRSEFADIQVLQADKTKVHLDARVNRYDAQARQISSFRSLWIITFDQGHWAAKFRSSFAEQ